MSQIKNLLLKFRYLKNELERVDTIVSESKKQFLDRSRKIQKDLNVYDSGFDRPFEKRYDESNYKKDDSQEINYDCNDDVVKSKKPAWSKKLFRKIATITHPDKIPENLSDVVKDKFLNFYQSATESYESNSFLDLIDIGENLGIKIEDMGNIDISSLNSKIKTIEDRIFELKSTIFWEWWHMSKEQKREVIKKFVKDRGWESARAQSKKSRPGHPGTSISQSRKKMQKD